MIVKLLTEHHLEFLSLKGDCRGSSEPSHVRMAHCWKSHLLAYRRLYGVGFKLSQSDNDQYNVIVQHPDI